MIIYNFIGIIFFLKPLVAQDMRINYIDELLESGGYISQNRSYDVKDSDLNLYLYTRNNSKTPIKIDHTTGEIDTSKSTKILIHGWTQNHKTRWYGEITQEYLIRGDFNVIQLDWERVAKFAYLSSAQNTKVLGNSLGQFLYDQKFPLENLHFIGLSLGAHLAGYAAKKIKKDSGRRVARVTGLDPAGPYFREPSLANKGRLSEDDADIVDVIHTDGGFYGFDMPLGTLDIYANGGRRPQPGCVDNFQERSLQAFIKSSFCSHRRSVAYFIEAINQGSFHCRKCDAWIDFTKGHCDSNTLYSFQVEEISTKTTGICYVNTNAEKPYL